VSTTFYVVVPKNKDDPKVHRSLVQRRYRGKKRSKSPKENDNILIC